MHYEINENTYAINFYDGGNLEPFQYQPHYPNGDAFDSYEEAEEWAKASIQAHDSNCGFFAPNGKGLEPERKPTERELTEMKLKDIGLTVDDLKTLLNLE